MPDHVTASTRRLDVPVRSVSHWYDFETDDEYWADGFVDAAVVALR
jgi:hypothetical protein